ncbi:MAG: hypothetical protein LBJ11_10890 [Oscillospiraceae bacterium]|jgi:hypothetical protein|nr:hypothetical protein [Oscillospiraceae bacterium]
MDVQMGEGHGVNSDSVFYFLHFVISPTVSLRRCVKSIHYTARRGSRQAEPASRDGLRRYFLTDPTIFVDIPHSMCYTDKNKSSGILAKENVYARQSGGDRYWRGCLPCSKRLVIHMPPRKRFDSRNHTPGGDSCRAFVCGPFCYF